MALNHEQPGRVPRLLYEEVSGYTPAMRNLPAGKCAPRSPREHLDMDITGVKPNPTRLSRERSIPWLGDRADAALASGRVDERRVWRKLGSFHHFVDIESPLKDVDDFDLEGMARIQRIASEHLAKAGVDIITSATTWRPKRAC